MRGAVRQPKKAPVLVTIVNVSRQRLPLAFFRACGYEGLRVLQGLPGSNISVVLVGDASMRKLNSQYCKKARPTNVLAFPYENGSSGSKKRIFGDIVLCVPQARREAKLFRRTLRTHLAVLLVHGMVHLAGYTHDTSREFRKMEKIEGSILKKLRLLP